MCRRSATSRRVFGRRWTHTRSPASKAGSGIPKRCWAWYLWRHYMMAHVQPNDGHRAVAAWQDFADVHVVTQNVDNLHERAGSTNVYHLHGNLFEFRCDRLRFEVRGRPARHAGTRRDDRTPGVPVRWPDPAECRVVRRAVARRRLATVGTGGEQRRCGDRRGHQLDRLSSGGPARSRRGRGHRGDRGQSERTPLSDSATISLRETAADSLPNLLQRLPTLLGSRQA